MYYVVEFIIVGMVFYKSNCILCNQKYLGIADNAMWGIKVYFAGFYNLYPRIRKPAFYFP